MAHPGSRQEINQFLKYLIFCVNFIFWVFAASCTVFGIYSYAKDFRSISDCWDFFLNVSLLLTVCGLVTFLIAFLGCIGALRENTRWLKGFSLLLAFSYIALLVFTFLLFSLFYSNAKTDISIEKLLEKAVKRYDQNENMRDLMDYLQWTLSCCGVSSSHGYNDWTSNALYNCSTSNLAPEQCAVPSSCCKINNSGSSPALPSPSVDIIIGTRQEARVDSDAPLVYPTCGFHAQEKSVIELQDTVYTNGCLFPLHRIFEEYAASIGAVVGAILVPVCLSIVLSNMLAKQIDRQRYLLSKQSKKEHSHHGRQRIPTWSTWATLPMGPGAQDRLTRHAMEISSHRHYAPSLPKKRPSPIFISLNHSPGKKPAPSFSDDSFSYPSNSFERFLPKHALGLAERSWPGKVPNSGKIIRRSTRPNLTRRRPDMKKRSWHSFHVQSGNKKSGFGRAVWDGPIIVELSSS